MYKPTHKAITYLIVATIVFMLQMIVKTFYEVDSLSVLWGILLLTIAFIIRNTIEIIIIEREYEKMRKHFWYKVEKRLQEMEDKYTNDGNE